MCLLYIFPPELHTLMTIFFIPFRKISFGCAANDPFAAKVVFLVFENFLPLRSFLRLGKR
jgi:hypothetical protein